MTRSYVIPLTRLVRIAPYIQQTAACFPMVNTCYNIRFVHPPWCTFTRRWFSLVQGSTGTWHNSIVYVCCGHGYCWTNFIMNALKPPGQTCANKHRRTPQSRNLHTLSTNHLLPPLHATPAPFGPLFTIYFSHHLSALYITSSLQRHLPLWRRLPYPNCTL